ncbi:neutral/alkaline non-lysosomal ceramidase N-terminal domain-containing protein, partial [bacterium]|nr:neutral/alkaline non-lysosomal ceramidase N-terminal domain-containing protein [bacterium]
MKKIRSLWIIGLVAFSSSCVLAADWRVGIARTEITPSKLLWMAGYAARKRPAEGTVHPLWAKALVIEDRCGGRGVIVTADLIGLTREISDAVGTRVHRRTGIERERIVLNSSHTHCSPVVGVVTDVTYGLNKQQQAAVDAYTRKLGKKLVKLIEEACGRMGPAKLTYGEGEATFA